MALKLTNIFFFIFISLFFTLEIRADNSVIEELNISGNQIPFDKYI